MQGMTLSPHERVYPLQQREGRALPWAHWTPHERE